MSCYNLSSSTINDIINTIIIPYIAAAEIPTNSYLNGTFNNFTIQNVSFSGSGGNTTTDGYYYTYDLAVEQCESILNFDVNTDSSYNICVNEEPINIPVNSSINYTYYTSITINASIQVQEEVYIPQVSGQICACCCCGDPLSSCCYNTCDCYNGVITPSTYNQDLLIPVGYNGTFLISLSSGNFAVSYQITSNVPESGTSINISIDTDNKSLPIIYITDIIINEITLNINSIGATDIPEPPDGFNVTSANNYIQSIFNEYVLPPLNQYLQTIYIKIDFGI